jgi:hypothetical protein
VPPGVAWRPAVQAGGERDLSARIRIVVESCGKSSTRGSLSGGSGSLRRDWRCTQLLLLRQIKKPLLGLQLALGATPPPLLSLQLLHMLLQPINTGLALSALPRQSVSLPLLRQLLPLLCGFSLLLRLLFTCLRALHGPLLA